MAEIKVTGNLIPTPRGPARIYRLKPPIVNEKAVRTLARRLGMQADAKIRHADERCGQVDVRPRVSRIDHVPGIRSNTLHRSSALASG